RTRQAGHLTECRGRQTAGRVRRHQRVEHVADLEPEFEPLLSADREQPEHGEIEVVTSGTVELIPSDIAEPDAGWLCERGGVEPGAVRCDIAVDVPGADEIGS